MDTKQINKTKRPVSAKTPSRRPQSRKKPANTTQVSINQSVVYLAPKPFNRTRLILQLVTILAVVVALILGISVFFKVEEFNIAGAEKYTPWQVYEASGIQEGENLLLLNRIEAEGRIMAALPYVKSVRVGIKLPGTVHIEIEELDVTYAIKDTAEQWWLISAAGTVVDRLAQEGNHTKILGVQLWEPKAGSPAAVRQSSTLQTDPQGNTIPVTLTAADRLSTVIDILGFLEKEGVVGQAASIDVNNMGDIQIWYGSQFQVKLGNHKELGSKISMMMASIRSLAQERPYEQGVLDVTDPGNVLFQSFAE